MKTKVTIQEIADFTGVSKFAVSRALSGKSGVSPQTRDMILKAANWGTLRISRTKPRENQRLQDPENRKWAGRCLFYSRMSVIKIGNPLLGTSV